MKSIVHMMNRILEYLRLMRLPGAIGVALPPIFGAISVNHYPLSIIAPLFLMGILSGIYGFVLNDYIDAELDRHSTDLSERSLVAGTISKKMARNIVIACFIGAYVIAFLFFYRPHFFFYAAIACLIVADILGGIYNIYGKRFVGSDFFLAPAQSLYFLFGALVASSIGFPGVLTWVLFFLVFIQLFYNNAIVGGLKDADHDYLMGVKNIALWSGVKVTKDKKVIIPLGFQVFGFGLRFLSVFVVFIPFVFYGMDYDLVQMFFLVVFSVILLGTSVQMLTSKRFDRGKLRKLIIVQLFLWYTIIPVMLISVIGMMSALLLIVLPALWYFFFSFVIGEKPLEPQI